MTFEPRHSDHPVSEISDGRTTEAAPDTFRAVVTPAVWIVAAVLAGVAPFLTFYSIGDGFGVDGFGRVQLPTALANNGVFYGSTGTGEHGIRIGVLVVVAAVLLLVAGAYVVIRPGRAAALSGVVGSAAMIFAALAVLLDAQSRVSGNDRQNHVTLGAGVWVSFAAGALGIVGAALGARDVLQAD